MNKKKMSIFDKMYDIKDAALAALKKPSVEGTIRAAVASVDADVGAKIAEYKASNIEIDHKLAHVATVKEATELIEKKAKNDRLMAEAVALQEAVQSGMVAYFDKVEVAEDETSEE